MPPSPEHDELKKLLEETRLLVADNNRLLREMRRFAILGFFAKTILWLVLLGVPLFFLSSYLAPLMDAFLGQDGGQMPAGLLGFPSEEQINQLIEQYQTEYQ